MRLDLWLARRAGAGVAPPGRAWLECGKVLLNAQDAGPGEAARG